MVAVSYMTPDDLTCIKGRPDSAPPSWIYNQLHKLTFITSITSVNEAATAISSRDGKACGKATFLFSGSEVTFLIQTARREAVAWPFMGG